MKGWNSRKALKGKGKGIWVFYFLCIYYSTTSTSSFPREYISENDTRGESITINNLSSSLSLSLVKTRKAQKKKKKKTSWLGKLILLLTKVEKS